MSNGRQDVERLEHDVDLIRTNIGELVRELNHRRREAFNLKLQFRRHAARVLVAGVTFVALVAGGITLVVRRLRRRRSWRVRAGRFADAFRRVLRHPEHLAERRPSLTRKVAAAGGSAVASALGKRLAKRLVSA